MAELCENYVIGMDCGSTNIKAIILADDGKVVAEASRPSTPYSGKCGAMEQDANEWWENSRQIFRQLADTVGHDVIRRVRGISISSHTVSLLPLDEAGNPLRRAMTYQDSRSVAEMNEITEQMGLEHFIKTVGGQPSPGFLPSKMLWYRKNEPELFEKTAWYVQASSYINYRLTGHLTTDIDQATRTQCLDITKMEWSDEIGEIIGVDLHKVMPKLKLVNEIIGFVRDDAAEETGLNPGTAVIAGCSDAMASMFATGMTTLGEMGESSGTSSLVFIGSMTKSAPDVPVVTRPCPLEAMPWIYDAPITTTGASIKWFIDHLAAEERMECEKEGKNIFTYLNEKALEANPGSDGLFFFPYLMGERAPLWNDYATGMMIGLGMNTNRADMARAIFEGTAYALRHVVDTVRESGGDAKLLRVCGGGAKSRTWNMIKASVLNMPVYVMDETSGDVPVGDALMVGHVMGLFPELEKTANEVIKVREIIEPDPEWVKVYDQLYPHYRAMYQALDPELSKMKDSVKKVCCCDQAG